MTYAPTFYPGTTSAEQAQRVTVTTGQALHISFSMVVTPTRRILGIIQRPDGTPLPGARASLRQVLPGGFASSNIAVMPDGQFTKTNVLPGDYFVDVNSGTGSMSSAGYEYASTPITVRSDLGWDPRDDDEIGSRQWDLRLRHRRGRSETWLLTFSMQGDIARPEACRGRKPTMIGLSRCSALPVHACSGSRCRHPAGFSRR